MNFEDIFNQIKQDSADLIKTDLVDYLTEAKSDIETFLKESKEDLKTYTEEFLKGEINAEELKFLVDGKKDLLVMKGLEQTGLAKIKIHEFKLKFLKMIVNKITGLI